MLLSFLNLEIQQFEKGDIFVLIKCDPGLNTPVLGVLKEFLFDVKITPLLSLLLFLNWYLN